MQRNGRQDILEHLAEVGQGVFLLLSGKLAMSYYLRGIECTEQVEMLLTDEVIDLNPKACGPVLLRAAIRK
jgi:hypothetical protein